MPQVRRFFQIGGVSIIQTFLFSLHLVSPPSAPPLPSPSRCGGQLPASHAPLSASCRTPPPAGPLPPRRSSPSPPSPPRCLCLIFKTQNPPSRPLLFGTFVPCSQFIFEKPSKKYNVNILLLSYNRRITYMGSNFFLA